VLDSRTGKYNPTDSHSEIEKKKMGRKGGKGGKERERKKGKRSDRIEITLKF